jgi:hypothetical protein
MGRERNKKENLRKKLRRLFIISTSVVRVKRAGVSFFNVIFVLKEKGEIVHANLAIFQPYHGKNELIFNEMMIRSDLYLISFPYPT